MRTPEVTVEKKGSWYVVMLDGMEADSYKSKRSAEEAAKELRAKVAKVYP